VEETVILEDQLSGAEVPPDVRVCNAANRHSEQAEREDGYEHPASLQEVGHNHDKSKRDCSSRAAF
jgi:hypothetical protein